MPTHLPYFLLAMKPEHELLFFLALVDLVIETSAFGI